MALSYIDWERGGVLVLTLVGRITLGEGTGLLRQLIADALALGKVDIVLKLGEVVYIDSSGLGELIAAHRTVALRGGRLKLAGLTSRAQQLINLTQLHLVFELYDNEELAIASF